MEDRVAWKTNEFEYRPKKTSWYWGSISIALVVLALAAWQGNIIFAIFVILAEVLVLTWGSRAPEEILCEITHDGIAIGETRTHRYEEIASFSVHGTGKKQVKLTFIFSKHLRPPLGITAPLELLPSLRVILIDHIPEKEYAPSFIEILEQFLGF